MRNTNMYYLVEQLSCFVLLVHVVLAANYVPTDVILLNCGANGETSDPDGRKWSTDIGSKFASSETNSIVSDATIQKPSISETPYMTARIFPSEFTYSFPLTSGRKFLRLYFYPADYPNLNATTGVFSVKAGQYTLLKNFSAYDTITNLNYDFISIEYSIYVESGTLNVTFTPARDTPNSYAFINGIEVVSHPDIYSSVRTSMLVGTSRTFDIDNSTALENVYRLNVAGHAISANGDTGMFRKWVGDASYIFGAAVGVAVTTDPNIMISYPPGMPDYVAPVDVYKTARSMGPTPEINLGFNLSWYFDVDTGFSYLVRLHFCEIDPDITRHNQRVFEIFINNQTAQPDADVIAWATKSKVPVYKDYVVFLPSKSPRQDLWLKLHPNTFMKPHRYDAILNGVEIFKINSTGGNLAGTLPNPIQKQDIIDPSRVLPHNSDKRKEAKLERRDI
uniref:receptor-like protein kinase FERONIA n=1 Tax=Erigeron canadensis TaxID=72917 RepID=UPI001CB9A955|nr:receptor-like protein kinase FERONIA [Erigeron canadensis]